MKTTMECKQKIPKKKQLESKSKLVKRKAEAPLEALGGKDIKKKLTYEAFQNIIIIQYQNDLKN